MPNFIRPGLGASDPDVERVGSHDASARARRREPLRRIDATALHAALPVYGLAAVFTVINAAARSQRWWAGIHEARPQSWGTVVLFQESSEASDAPSSVRERPTRLTLVSSLYHFNLRPILAVPLER